MNGSTDVVTALASIWICVKQLDINYCWRMQYNAPEINTINNI
jgi:hypothetical protein